MEFKGAWILGSQGTKRLVELKSQLDTRSLNQISKKIGKDFYFYEPWMSHEPTAVKIYEKDLFLSDCFLVHDEDDLSIVQKQIDILNQNQNVKNNLNAYIDQKVSGLNKEYINEFLQNTHDSLELILKTCETFKIRFSALVSNIIPLMLVPDKPRSIQGRGLSSHFFRGYIFLEPPYRKEFFLEEYALNLVHELGHQALFIYQNADDIVLCDSQKLVYSVIRKTPRPAFASLHALVVCAYMLEFVLKFLERQMYTNHASKEYMEFRRDELKNNIMTGIGHFMNIPLTAFGASLLDEILSTARAPRNKINERIMLL